MAERDPHDREEVKDTHTEEDPLEALVGEGKKFRTVEDLARGKLEADRFIEQLLAEKRQLEEELEKRMTVDELLEQLQSAHSNQPDDDETPEAGEQGLPETDENEDEKPDTPIDPSVIERLVEEKLKQKEEQERIQRAANTVAETFKSVFGEKASEEYAKRVEEAGLSKEAINALLRDNPKTLLKVLGVEGNQQKPVSVAAPGVDIRIAPTDNPANFVAGDQPKTYSYYRAKMKEDPSLRDNPAFQAEMAEAAVRMGERFFLE